MLDEIIILRLPPLAEVEFELVLVLKLILLCPSSFSKLGQLSVKTFLVYVWLPFDDFSH
jgi:hypothetical protein